eukprot:1161429-Pelagomonas_calceolata.AAC.3
MEDSCPGNAHSVSFCTMGGRSEKNGQMEGSCPGNEHSVSLGHLLVHAFLLQSSHKAGWVKTQSVDAAQGDLALLLAKPELQ